jgi:hypothetical protein
VELIGKGKVETLAGKGRDILEKATTRKYNF